ncbi:hypothetical protein [Neobacillus mesonae]|uniref:hypothetical protein n=1 Tax=Neobacillus mesonae TaxID=1193713 RepID=UPI00203D2670|nr:hypothetical protein [Neobacillus mesonae]MCM3568154.1 hypothetical protein [Neobacillus mesonae]
MHPYYYRNAYPVADQRFIGGWGWPLLAVGGLGFLGGLIGGGIGGAWGASTVMRPPFGYGYGYPGYGGYPGFGGYPGYY